MPLSMIRIEDEVFVAEGAVGIGAVREVTPKTLTVYFEGYGDVELGPDHIASAHDGKVVVDPTKLPQDLQDRLDHIHDGEYRNMSET